LPQRSLRVTEAHERIIDMYAWADQRPYVEFHEGRKVVKVSPNTWHSLVQVALASILRPIAKGHGLVGTEWHFDMTLQLGAKTILLPDIAYVRKERLFGLSESYLQIPNFAPDVAIEIRSPSDRPGIRDWKRAQYLEAGSDLVLDVDPERRTIRAFAPGSDERIFVQGETFQHPATLWLRFEVAEAFSDLDP
jgi:Uma2 family endonuclease